MNTQIQGAMTQQRCFLKCIEAGFIVSKPLFDNARYDFMAAYKTKERALEVLDEIQERISGVEITKIMAKNNLNMSDVWPIQIYEMPEE